MSSNKSQVDFDCPWCGKYQSKQVYNGAETETICSECKKLVGIITDATGKPIVIATKVHKSTLTLSPEMAETKLGKTEADIEKARKEAERRGLVVESKVYGAAIEIIDRLRDQLKQQDEMSKEIMRLKEQIELLNKRIELYRILK